MKDEKLQNSVCKIRGMHMPSLITVYLLVSLENASGKFGTKYELHTRIYPNHQGKLLVSRSYRESRTLRAQRVLPSRCGTFLNDEKKARL